MLTGEAAVTIGAVGQGMVAGDLVNTASRLQSVAPPGTVLVGESTQRAAAASIVFEPAGEQVLKGKAAPVPAWLAVRVVAERGGRGRSDTASRRRSSAATRSCGCSRTCFNATGRERRARLVSVTGQGGIGKSRLAWEFLKYIDGVLEDVYWHEGRSPAYGEGITFWALGEMVRRRADLARATTRRRPASGSRRRSTSTSPTRRSAAGSSPRCWPCWASARRRPRQREELFAAWRTFFERIADRRHGGHGLRGPPMGRRGPARLHRPRARVVARPTRSTSSPSPAPSSSSAARTGAPGAATRLDVARPPARGVDARAARRARAGAARGARRERSSRAPRASRCTRSRPSGCWSRTGGWSDCRRRTGRPATSASSPCRRRSRRSSRPDSTRSSPTDRALIQDAAVLGQRFSVASAGRGHRREPRRTSSRVCGRSSAASCCGSTRDPRSPERGQYGFVQALIREVAYGTLAQARSAGAAPGAARYFETLGDDELAGVLAAHYLAAHQAAPEGAEGEAVAVQAKLALRGAAERARALGSHEQVLVYPRPGSLRRDRADRAHRPARADGRRR